MIELCLAVDQCVSWPDSATVGRSTAGRSTATATTTLLADWSPDIDIDIDAWMRWRSQQFRVCMQNRQSTISVAAVTLHNISRAVDWACKSPLLVACLSWLWVLFPIAVADFHSFITNLIELPLLLLLPGGTRSLPISLSLSFSLGLGISFFLSFDVCTLQMIMNWFLIARSVLLCMHTLHMIWISSSSASYWNFNWQLYRYQYFASVCMILSCDLETWLYVVSS